MFSGMYVDVHAAPSSLHRSLTARKTSGDYSTRVNQEELETATSTRTGQVRWCFESSYTLIEVNTLYSVLNKAKEI
jgi:hypothetical protein